MEEQQVRRLGVFGGTFDPIHMGHLVAASEALHAFQLDRVLFVPAGQPWQKQGYSPAEDRYLMTMLGTVGHPRFAVSRIELDRRGPTYTADTLQSLRDLLGDLELFFIAGTDAAQNLGTWHDVARVARLAELIVVTRPGAAVADVASGEALPKTHLLTIPGVAVSATEVRQRVREARPIDYLVPREVALHIRQQGLYLDQPGAASA